MFPPVLVMFAQNYSVKVFKEITESFLKIKLCVCDH